MLSVLFHPRALQPGNLVSLPRNQAKGLEIWNVHEIDRAARCELHHLVHFGRTPLNAYNPDRPRSRPAHMRDQSTT